MYTRLMDKRFQRFINKVDKHGPKVLKTKCWMWRGALGRGAKGEYGQLRSNKKYYLAHRFSYLAHKGRIPKGLVIDHLCRVPACVNPTHLEAVTVGENIRRGSRPTATHCKNGHLFDKGNTYRKKNGRHRQCRACGRKWAQAKRDRAKQHHGVVTSGPEPV